MSLPQTGDQMSGQLKRWAQIYMGQIGRLDHTAIELPLEGYCAPIPKPVHDVKMLSQLCRRRSFCATHGRGAVSGLALEGRMRMMTNVSMFCSCSAQLCIAR